MIPSPTTYGRRRERAGRRPGRRHARAAGGDVAQGPEVDAAVRALIADAEAREDREVDAALDTALGIVPRPLRGVVRKVLLG